DEGSINTKNLEYGVYYIRQVDGESYDSFELKEIFPLKIKMVEKEKYYQGDKIKIAWNGRPELMYRVEVKSKTPVNKLVQGNLFEFSIQNTEEIEITITEQKFERSSTAKVSMSISKDLDIIGVQELDGAGVGIHQLQLKNPRKVSFRVQVRNNLNKLIINKVTTKELIDLKIGKPGLYSVKLLNIKTKNEYYSTELTVNDKLINNGTPKQFISVGKDFPVLLKWNTAGSYASSTLFKVKIFNINELDEPIFETETSSNQLKYTFKNETEFKWSVEAVAVESIKASVIHSSKATRPEIPTVKATKIILSYVEDKDCYLYNIPAYKHTQKYDVFVYSSRTKVKGSWKIMYRKKLSTNSDCIKSKGEGKYFYKYRLIDIWGRKSKFSKMGEIFFPISPLSDF
ncbi:MAG: hypothetical protein HON90_04920, partial [Halobacteriovoraceae bacterium]|nr:hypothetical protein [Halobacteriovoraceae bacterium]